MGNGPQICQMIGEPYHFTISKECVKCSIDSCPIWYLLKLNHEHELEITLLMEKVQRLEARQ